MIVQKYSDACFELQMRISDSLLRTLHNVKIKHGFKCLEIRGLILFEANFKRLIDLFFF